MQTKISGKLYCCVVVMERAAAKERQNDDEHDKADNLVLCYARK